MRAFSSSDLGMFRVCDCSEMDIDSTRSTALILSRSACLHRGSKECQGGTMPTCYEVDPKQ